MNIKSGGIINQILDLIDNNKKLVEINQDFRIRTGILNFFKSRADIMEFRNFLNSFKKIYDKKSDMGDFQTPMELTDKICEYISKTGFKPSILLEPTCGSGNFIFSALKYFPTLKYIYCVELQKEYDWIFKVNLLLKSFSTKINVE
ncbi:MAG: N-6 DNA methylase, partial [Candidatus Helarchaeota archaeon]